MRPLRCVIAAAADGVTSALSAREPLHPQPHSPLAAETSADAPGACGAGEACVLPAPVRVRSLDEKPDLPRLDIALRRAIEALRPLPDGVEAIVPTTRLAGAAVMVTA